MRSTVALYVACAVAAMSFAMAAVLGVNALWPTKTPDPFMQYGAPTEYYAHDQIVFGDGQIISVQDMFAGIDGSEWADFARRVGKSGGRFERVECEIWKLDDTRQELQRCIPGPIKWYDAVAYDFQLGA